MEFCLSSTRTSTQGEMHAPNNMIPLLVYLWHTPNTPPLSRFLSACVCINKTPCFEAEMIRSPAGRMELPWGMKLSLYMIRRFVLLSLGASRWKLWWQYWRYTSCPGWSRLATQGQENLLCYFSVVNTLKIMCDDNTTQSICRISWSTKFLKSNKTKHGCQLLLCDITRG